MSLRISLRKDFLKSLAAVLLGNLAYFSLLPYLPESARHQPFRLDLGLLVDAWFCLVFYGLVDLGARAWGKKRRG